MREIIDLWIGLQTWIFEAVVAPFIYRFGLMVWYEPAFNAVEIFMLGIIQVAVISLGMRALEKRWPLERTDGDSLVGVDRVYTVLSKLGIVPLFIFVATYPVTNGLEYLVRSMGMAPPRIEHLAPWLHANAFASFLIYFVLYDFAAYWVHRAQHGISWWWALHSLHHSQRQVTVWSDDRNHIVDDILVTLVLAIFSQFVGVQPDDYVLILLIGRLVESWSHANIDMGFGWLGNRLLVSPHFHRLHHAMASSREPHVHDHNYAPVFPIWDLLFGTAIWDFKYRPTGVDNAGIDRDNGRGWIAQQITVLGRFLLALAPNRLKRA